MNSKRKASREKRTNHYNVLAVYYLRYFAGRDMFVGTLDEMSNKLNWHLDTVRPGKFFTSANQLYRIYKRHFGSTIRQDQTS